MNTYDRSGVAEFIVGDTSSTFRFRVTTVEEKLRIWLEDDVSKKQWQTKDLALDTFVTVNTAIPMAKVADYAQRIVHCLSPTNDADKPSRQLSRPMSDGSRELVVSFLLTALAFETKLEYRFTLAQVPMDVLELLTLRVRDLEATVTTLQHENATLQATHSKFGVELTLPQPTAVCVQFRVFDELPNDDHLLVWRPVDKFPLGGFTLARSGLAVAVNGRGVYSIHVDAATESSVKLLVNKKPLAQSSGQLVVLNAGDSLSCEKKSATGSLAHVSLVLVHKLPEREGSGFSIAEHLTSSVVWKIVVAYLMIVFIAKFMK